MPFFLSAWNRHGTPTLLSLLSVLSIFAGQAQGDSWASKKPFNVLSTNGHYRADITPGGGMGEDRP